jgi:NADH oxidase (H2O2-forming)
MRSRSDVLILGGGPAGITFGRNLKKLKPETGITMLRPESRSMIYCAIPYVIEGIVDPSQVLKSDDLVTQSGIQLVRRAAVSVDLKHRVVEDDQGDVYSYGEIFISTGATPVLPPIPGIDGENVYTVKTQRDMELLIGKINEGARRAVVVGAGAIGIEQAQAYRAKGLETWLVDSAPHVLPNMLDHEFAEPVERTLRDEGVRLVTCAQVVELEKTGSRVSTVMLSNGATIALDPERDFLCFAVGMKPDVELFQDQGLDILPDGIVVNSRMETSIPGVYAGGDCVSFRSAIDGKAMGGKLATNAVPMGKIAARAMAGRKGEYAGFYNGAATCAYSWRIGSTGFTEETARRRGMETISGKGETKTLFPMMPGAGTLQVKIVADAKDRRIVGGQVLSELPAADKVDVITLAIQNRMTLDGLAELSYSAQPWQSFFPARSAIVDACEAALEMQPIG